MVTGLRYSCNWMRQYQLHWSKQKAKKTKQILYTNEQWIWVSERYRIDKVSDTIFCNLYSIGYFYQKYRESIGKFSENPIPIPILCWCIFLELLEGSSDGGSISFLFGNFQTNKKRVWGFSSLKKLHRTKEILISLIGS